MKKIAYLIAFVFTLTLISCGEDSTAGLTHITYYAELTLEGESTLYLDKGDTFVEPGYTATMNGEDVTDQVTVTSNVDTSTSGVYTISYSIVNDDGFYSTATRKVIVMDPNDPIEGYWDTDADSYRDYNGQTLYGASYPILIFNNGDGTYDVEDMLGGWYYYRAGYGSSYAMAGVITIDGSTVTLESSYIPGWGDSLDSLEDGVYDAATGMLSWHVSYAGYLEFYVTMYKR